MRSVLLDRGTRRGFTLIELLVVIAIIGILSGIVLASLNVARTKNRDSVRISDVRQIQYALELYYDANGRYPQCLEAGGICGTYVLEGSSFMPEVPLDPKTGLSYSYAGIGTGTLCTGYHLGASLEEKSNRALLVGKDAVPRARCNGSANDFSGLSYAAGGQKCTTTVGIAQPTSAANGESCYDVTEQ
jgi:prepilin-type N-terminal cleavage/methylation domain-containing protein